MEVGTLRIKTKIDTQEAISDLGALEKAIERVSQNLAKSAENIGVGKGLEQSQESMAAFEAQTKAMTAEIDALKAKYAELQQYIASMAATSGQSGNQAAGPISKIGQAAANAAQIVKDAASSIISAIGRIPQAVHRTADSAKRIGKEFLDSAKKAKTAALKIADSFAKTAVTSARAFTKIGLAMLSIRGVYGILRRASSVYLADNAELTGKINSMWSALGEMLGPIITSIVNMLLKAITIINAFIAALSGINFIARANAKALDKQAKATAGAGGAAAKAAGQLASFDEMNKLTDTSGGGGGGGAAAELQQLDDSELFKGMEDKLKDIMWYVGAIAAGLLAWKLASGFGASLAAAAGLAALIAGSIIAVKGFIDAFNNGVDWQNLAEMIAGVALAAGGLFLLFGNIGAAIGLLAGGIGLLVVGIKDFVETGELSVPVFAAIEAGLLAIGAAIFLLTGSWIPLVVAAVAGVVVAIYTYWDDIKNACKTAWNWIISNVWEPIKNIGEYVGIWLSSKATEIADTVNGVCLKVKKFFSDAWVSIKSTFSNVGTFFQQKFSDAWTKIKNVFSGWGTFFSGLWTKIKDTFSGLGTTLGDAIGGSVKTAINGVLSAIESTVNKAVSIINSAISAINTLPGVSVSYLSRVSFPRLARGGIVNNPGRGVPAIIGEAGKEAVLPLERNTEWMDILADKINGGRQLVIPIYMDGKKIARYVIDLGEQRAFALNGG